MPLVCSKVSVPTAALCGISNKRRAVNEKCAAGEKYTVSEKSNEASASFILKEVSLRIDSGKVMGLAGKSGVGKTTLMSAIMGCFSQWSGQVTCSGRIARVMQRPERQLFAKTAFDDCAFGLRNENLSSAEIKKRVENIFSVLDIDAEEAQVKSPFAYSGGEKRRLAIAGIVVTGPDFILMDEPTAGLDSVQIEEVVRLIKRLKSGELFNKPIGFLISSHNSDFLWEVSDDICLLHQGSVAYAGSCAELMQHDSWLQEAGLKTPSLAEALIALQGEGAEINACAWESPECAKEAIVTCILNEVKGAKSKVKVAQNNASKAVNANKSMFLEGLIK
jgi:energy-coupling factor transporter ATP-binding protein EcfA2